MLKIFYVLLGFSLCGAAYHVDLEPFQELPSVNNEFELRFSLKDSLGKRLEKSDLNIEHEHLIHLMGIDKQFLAYIHTHPVEISPGIWSARLKVGGCGLYRIWLQYKPSTSDHSLTSTADVLISCFDPRLIARQEGYEAKIGFLNGPPTATKMSVMKLQIKKDGHEIAPESWDNYLGVKMHIAAISKDLNHFVHAHPSESNADETHLHFMADGVYVIFAQFKHLGVLRTMQFSVVVR